MTKLQALLQTSASNFNLSTNVRISLETLRYADSRINSTGVALSQGKIKTARAWMGAGISNQHGALTGLAKYINDTTMVNETMQVLNSSTVLASNALGMIRAYDLFGNQTVSWDTPKTERDGLWEASPKQGSELWSLQFPQGLVPNVTVCKVGCDCSSVQQAVDRAPPNSMTAEEAVDIAAVNRGKQFVILIKEGVYAEMVKVAFEKTNVVFLGEGIGKTVITGSLNVAMPNVTTRSSATLSVYGDGFMASNMTIENSAEIDVQAVALLADSDRTLIENCAILGHQDTLYANALRQYYKSCQIEGTVDFIFGNAIAFFQDCTILVRPRVTTPEVGDQSAITAHSRMDPSQVSGFVFQNCVINGTDKYAELYRINPKVHNYFLGRPWREFARTVYISCVMDIVCPEGWSKWVGDQGLQTLYYGEFNSTGPAANPVGRVPWSNQIPPDHVASYSLQNFIQGSLEPAPAA
ncbi:probable pectinesterase/pectinesterase inhibitor 51 [Daucus carota subsp. sativus]